MAQFQVGDTVVDLTTGQRFKVADAPMDLDEKKYGRIQGETFTGSPADIKTGAAGRVATEPPPGNLPPPPGEIIPPEALAQGRQRSVKEAGEVSSMLARNVAVPAAQAGIGLATGGLSIPAQMLIGGGTELGAQAAGLAPKSMGQVALAATPPLVKPAFQAARSGLRGLGQMIAPTALREAGTEAAAKVGGMAPDVVERAFQPKLSGKLYEVARSAGNIGTSTLKAPIDDAIKAEQALSTPDRSSLKLLSNLSRKLASVPETNFDDVINEIQRLEKRASALYTGKNANPVAAKNLSDAADALADTVSKANPAYKAAVNRYLRERTTTKIVDAIREGNASAKLNKLIDHEAGRISKAFSKDEINEIRQVAGQVAEAVGSGGEGFANRTFNAFTKPFSDMMESSTGRALLRNTLGPMGKGGERSATALATALQFWRAYAAQGGDQPTQ